MKFKKTMYLLTAAVLLTGCGNAGKGASNSDANGSGNVIISEDGTEIKLNDSEVSFSSESGLYSEAFKLELDCGGAENIYYTTDGSDPRTSDTRLLYEAPIDITDRENDENIVSAVDPALFSGNYSKYDYSSKSFEATVKAPDISAVDKCTVIKAAAEADDGSYSQSFTQTFYIGTPEEHIQGLRESCEAMGTTLAVVSISMEYDDLFDSEKGIYVKGDIFDAAFEEYLESGEKIDGETARQLDANYKQKGREWERECHIDFFEFSADGAELALSQDCGIRIQGNYSRSDLQKGLRLFARRDYGDNKFRYPIFGEGLKDTSGKTIDNFKTLVLRAGGNCAFTSKFNDTYWQDLVSDLDCTTKASRPCVVYLNGEYWGVYVLEEDYSDNYFEDHFGVVKENVAVYKGDAESLELGYALDEGTLPEGETDESYYFNELNEFFSAHSDLTDPNDYEEFSKLVDIESVRDYFLAEIWINNKWDWPGKNWSMWKTTETDPSNEYADGRWRFMFYDMEFGGVSGGGDAYANTIKDDNYKPLGLLDRNTDNPAVLCYAYLMTNEDFRSDFNSRLLEMSEGVFEKENAIKVLDEYTAAYEPLFDQFFERYPGSGSTDNAINGGYASVSCIKDFLSKRGANIQPMVDWVNEQYS
ncbi:CotH kinase family protein [Ruminococcus sp. Marseille-P6503]|uniref:CotH kinase family protein n=1 Tax=Ruminococcus sp. Marseille-P6503 TaxID=2364796 RepID=UPI0013DE031B|nr:CotH kinase family protein [Ruminococcus sp. Marseille-P6503]